MVYFKGKYSLNFNNRLLILLGLAITHTCVWELKVSHNHSENQYRKKKFKSSHTWIPVTFSNPTINHFSSKNNSTKKKIWSSKAWVDRFGWKVSTKPLFSFKPTHWTRAFISIWNRKRTPFFITIFFLKKSKNIAIHLTLHYGLTSIIPEK